MGYPISGRGLPHSTTLRDFAGGCDRMDGMDGMGAEVERSDTSETVPPQPISIPAG